MKRAAFEFNLLAVGFLLYNAGRLAIVGQESLARKNAELVYRFEEAVRLPSEAAIQDAFGSVPFLFELANRYYVTIHFPVMIAFVVWGFAARPIEEYRWARNLLVTLSFLALTIHLAFPLAPPRMFADWGFVDTMAIWGPSAYEGASADVANQFAAMPSLHVGWALLIAVVLHRTAPRGLAALAHLHAGVTIFVVTVTANHWWVDGIVAAGLLVVALAVFPRPGASRLSPPFYSHVSTHQGPRAADG